MLKPETLKNKAAKPADRPASFYAPCQPPVAIEEPTDARCPRCGGALYWRALAPHEGRTTCQCPACGVVAVEEEAVDA